MGVDGQKRAKAVGEQLHAMLADRLGAAIVGGDYAVGSRLPGEMAATETFAVSRPAYREAIRILSSKGLVESLPKAGTMVCPRSRWNLLDPDVLGWLLHADRPGRFARELLDLRAMIEPAAAAAAAKRRDERDLAAMSEALAAMADNAPDSPAGQAADRRFHDAMFAATGNELVSRLAAIVATSVDFVAEYKRSSHVERDPRPDHEALYQAIADRRAADASAIMRDLLHHADGDLRSRT